MASRAGYLHRLENTEVRVYSTVSGETEVASCGTVTGINKILSLFKNVNLELFRDKIVLIYLFIVPRSFPSSLRFRA